MEIISFLPKLLLVMVFIRAIEGKLDITKGALTKVVGEG